MNKDSEEMEINELSDQSFDFKHITWKVSNSLLLPDLVDHRIESPTFSFAGGSWKLGIYPYGETKFESEGYIDFNMIRLNSRFPNQRVFYNFYFKTNDGKQFKSYSNFTNFNSSKSSSGGCIRYQKKTTFMDNKDILVSNGVLTIVYQMRTQKIAVMDRYSQIESTELLSEIPVDKIVQDFKELFLKQEDCDVIINVKEHEFRAHKIILSARSSVFSSTFRNDMKEKATGIIDIKDCDPSSFSDFLCFLYCGKVENLKAENVFSLFTTADKYDVQDLRSKCLEFMKKNLSVDTFCETVTVALQYLEMELLDLATDFFAKNLQEIIVTIKWQKFVVENPIQSNEIMIKSLVSNKKVSDD